MLKRPKARFLVVAFSLFSLVILLLGACGAPSGPAGGGTTTGKPVKGGTWIEDIQQEPNSLIPTASNQTFAYMVDFTLYASLVYGDPQGTLHAGIATDIPTLQNGGVSQDLKTWVFHLRPNLVWSDGQPLNADDVDYTWKLWKDPKFGSYSPTAVQAISSADVSSDKLTITFHLSQPFVAFLQYWADGYYGIMPKHHFASMAPDQIKKSPDNLNPSVVSGPFMMLENKSGDHITVTRNPKWYRVSEGLPYLDKIVFRITPDQNTILKDLQAGTIDAAWFLDASKVAAYKALNGYGIAANQNTTSFEAIYFNFNNKVLGGNQEVRQAISMAIDQPTLIRVSRQGIGAPLCTEHSKASVPGYQADAPCPKFDLNAANTLLDQHGWVKGADGVRAKGGQRLEFQYSTVAGIRWREQDELINQSNLQKIGIKIDLHNYPSSTLFGTFLSDAKPGVYDIVEFATGVSYDPDSSALFMCGLIGNTYCNKKLDDLYKQELSTADNNARQQIFNQIHQIELTDFPFVVLFGSPDIAVRRNNTHNYLPSAVGIGDTVNTWEWWCDGGKCL